MSRSNLSKEPITPSASRNYPQAGLHGRIVHEIGRRIVSGRIAPGERLPSHAHLGASRGVFREAIKVLAAKGLVVSRPKTGTRVRPTDAWSLLDPDVFAWRQEGQPRGAFLRNLTEVRLIIEPASAELAARRASPAQLESLRHALRDMREALDASPSDFEAYNDADFRFHRAIVDACNNDVLEQMNTIVGTSLIVAFEAAVTVPGLARASLPRHQAILDAIRRRQPNRARATMRLLVMNTGRSIGRLPRNR